MPYVTTVHELVINNGEFLSEPFPVEGADIVGVAIESDWDNDAYLGLALSEEVGTEYLPALTRYGYPSYIRRIYSQGYYDAPSEFSGIHGFARIRSITAAGTPKPQSGDVALRVVVRTV